MAADEIRSIPVFSTLAGQRRREQHDRDPVSGPGRRSVDGVARENRPPVSQRHRRGWLEVCADASYEVKRTSFGVNDSSMCSLDVCALRSPGVRSMRQRCVG